jgi:hypothetical protein
VAPRQQRKPSPEASPPRRTAIPAPANDNRAKKRVAIMAGAVAVAAIAAYVVYRLLG